MTADMVERARVLVNDIERYIVGEELAARYDTSPECIEIAVAALSTVAREVREDTVAMMRAPAAQHIKNAEQEVRRRGYEPRALQMKWRRDPPLYGSAEWYDESLHAIIDALCHEGIPAWSGDATSCVQQILVACIEKERREAAREALEAANGTR